MMDQLEKDYQYYIDNQAKLAEKYAGKYLVIKNAQIDSVYDSEIEAYQEAKKKYKLGTFLIKPCLPPDSNITPIFHTRVSL